MADVRLERKTTNPTGKDSNEQKEMQTLIAVLQYLRDHNLQVSQSDQAYN